MTQTTAFQASQISPAQIANPKIVMYLFSLASFSVPDAFGNRLSQPVFISAKISPNVCSFSGTAEAVGAVAGDGVWGIWDEASS